MTRHLAFNVNFRRGLNKLKIFHMEIISSVSNINIVNTTY